MTIQQIIRNEVLANASQMITDLANEGSHWINDAMSCISAPDYSEAPNGYEARQGARGFVLYEVGGDDCIDDWAYPTERDAIIAAWEDAGDEPDHIEALQHWLVSDYLADKLEEVGALVSRDVLGFNVWGRTECGQALEDDADLNRVAKLINAQ